MAIAPMQKILIVSHRSEAAQLLDALQADGLCQILNAEHALISKEYPELHTESQKPKDIEELVARINNSIAFLKKFTKHSGGLASALAPKMLITRLQYEKIAADKTFIDTIEHSEQTQSAIDKLKSDIENYTSTLETLKPWKDLLTPAEELKSLAQAAAVTGLIPIQKFGQISDYIAKSGAGLEIVGSTSNSYACLIVCLPENLAELQKLLRSVDFEAVNFESMTGTIAANIETNKHKLALARKELEETLDAAKKLAENLGTLEILSDHYTVLLKRENTRAAAPATEQTVVLEGWTRKKDCHRLEKTIAKFGASTMSLIEPGEGEEIPVEIDNNNSIKPFETITRLYGMPSHLSIDPTVFLAPFFALFFGLCLTDAGYGLVMVAILWYFLRKYQGDKRVLWMLMICAVMTVAAGAVTGGWFGDAVTVFLPAAENLRKSIMLFDPMTQPMIFFGLSLALGYIQIMFGLSIAFTRCLLQKDYASAFCNQLTLIVLPNSLILLGLSKAGMIPPQLSTLFAVIAIATAMTIFLFSERNGTWSGRLGMGFFNLFCTVFFAGDVLSYVRIMALGMVSSGFGMAVNILVTLVGGVPYVGWLLGALMFVSGHLFNLALSVLGSFVHSMRLQFVEFFPKFFEGGGKQFEPLKKEYKYIHFGRSV